MKLINKTFLFTFLIIGAFLQAQGPPPPPDGGGGGVGPGTPASPIDMYVYILAIAAIFFITLYAKRIQNKQAV